MTELSPAQKIRVIKAILDEEIASYEMAITRDDKPRINGKHDLSPLGMRLDTLISLREKLEILKEFQ